MMVEYGDIGMSYGSSWDDKIRIVNMCFIEYATSADKANNGTSIRFGTAYTDEGYMTDNYLFDERDEKYIKATPDRFKIVSKERLIELLPEHFI